MKKEKKSEVRLLSQRTLPPTADDLAQIDLAIRSFQNAWGCVSPDGEFRPGIVDPTLLWMMIGSGPTQMAALWRQLRIATDDKSSYAEMMQGKQHTVHLQFFKIRKSLFRSAWIGNVNLQSDRSSVYAGSVAGRTQADMWRQLRGFLEAGRELYPSTSTAAEAA